MDSHNKSSSKKRPSGGKSFGKTNRGTKSYRRNRESLSLPDGFVSSSQSEPRDHLGNKFVSGVDHIFKSKKKSRKDLRKKMKLERQQKIKNHELWKQSRKLGISVEEMSERMNKKRKRESMERYNEDDEDLEASLEKEVERQLKKTKSKEEEEDDRIIRDLGKKLGLDGKKSKKKLIGDGFDFLFKGIGSDIESEGENDKKGQKSYKHLQNETDSEMETEEPLPKQKKSKIDIYGKGWKKEGESEDESEEMGSKSENEMEDEMEDDEEEMCDDEDSEDNNDDGDNEMDEMDRDESESQNESEKEEEEEYEEEEEDDEESDNDDDQNDDYDQNDDKESQDDEDEDKKNDDQIQNKSSSILDKLANLPSNPSKLSSGAYIPPALRAQMRESGLDPEIQKMTRELRGHVNRLSDSNLETSFELIEGLFSKYPRKSVQEELIRIFLDDCKASVGAATVFTFAPTYAALTMMLHAVVGPEVGGNVVQTVARELSSQIKSRNIAVTRNLLLMFISLYNYSVIHCSMLYDIIRLLIDNIDENTVDLLLLLIQKSGMQLRKDDPASIKEIIKLVNEVATQWKSEFDAYESSKDEKLMPKRGRFTKRVQFMLESLNDVRNNRLVSQENDLPTLKMKASIDKYWKKRFKKQVPTPEPLKISWNDLIESDHLGRWWVVGSATQIPSDQRPEARKQAEIQKALQEASRNNDIETLAKAQRMNTAARKAIFSIIVTSEDYIDACEKLTRFEAKDISPREIVQVLLHCCTQEASWNPYYGDLAEKLCSLDHHYKISFKFLLWEKIDNIEDLSVRALSNLAKLYAYLIGANSIAPTILKVFTFEAMSAKSIVFLRLLLVSLFLGFEENQITNIFAQLAASKDGRGMIKGLEVFLITNMKTIKPEIVKQSRLAEPPYSIPDSEALDHVKSVTQSVKKILARAASDM